jgi:predicted ATP-dependent endonuclease of OLD family
MGIQKIQLTNFTVFEELEIEFCQGINIFIGENGTGKTHLMKLLYAACKAMHPKVSFSQKIVQTFRPDDFRIGRLVKRKPGVSSATVNIDAQKENDDITKSIAIGFSTKTQKWEATVTGEESWEQAFLAVESTFIPAKEILSNAYNLPSANEKNNVDFDDTYIDIIHSAKVNISRGPDTKSKQPLLNRLENMLDGKVYFDPAKDQFYITGRAEKSKLEFNLVAEGIRKIALLWQLVKNGTLEKGSILFWDEPETNINPRNIPFIVDMLLELQERGVQIFISTHDYTLSKCFDIKARENSVLTFHSLYKTTDQGVRCESSEKFKNIEKNDIRDAFIQLYHDEIEKELES